MRVSVQFPGTLSPFSQSCYIDSPKYWSELISNLLEAKYKFLFNEDTPRDYILLYLNGIKLENLKDIRIKDEDSLVILSAISGG